MTTPKKVQVRQEPEGPVYVYANKQWGFAIVLLFGLFFALFPWWVMIKHPQPGIVIVFLLLITAVGLGISYWCLVMMINRTEIRVWHGLLSVRQKPLPWKRQLNIPVGDILSVSQETYYNRNTDPDNGFTISIRNERLVAALRSGAGAEKSVILIPTLELAAAQFLAQMIENRLGRRQTLTSAEQEMATEFSQQEEKRVEAVQNKGFLFFAMLLVPIAVIAGLAMLIGVYNAEREAQASLSWPSAVGQLSEYTVHTHHPDEDSIESDVYYDITVAYTYAVGGKSYTFDQSVGGHFDTQMEADQFARTSDTIAPTLVIYYHPENPSRARSTHEGPGAIPFIMGGVLFVMGLLAVPVVLARGRSIARAEGTPDDWKHWSFWRAHIPFLGSNR